MISLENINVYFKKGTQLENHSLKNINFKIEDQEFVTVIGGNGAGKSTLMNVIAGNFHADSGRISIDGKDVTHLPTAKRASLLSRVFQNPEKGSFPTLSVAENLAIAYKRGKRRSLFLPAFNQSDIKYFKELVAELGLGLENRLKDPMESLSGGQRQAISLLMSIMQPSKIILLDEHTAALDPKMSEIVLSLTEKLIKEHNLTALMITHSMHQALEHGTRTLLMHHGEIIRDLSGDERSRLTAEELIKLFD